MTTEHFEHTFKSLQIPVIVCKKESNYPVIYINNSAKILLNPMQPMEVFSARDFSNNLEEVIRFQKREEFHNIINAVDAQGSIDKYRTSIYSFEDAPIPVNISANSVVIMDEEFFVIYIYEARQDEPLSIIDTNNMLTMVFHAAYHTTSVHGAINQILGLVGSYVNVSRVYIFEEISAIMTRNTYEWCSEGTEPAIDGLQNLKKEDYSYDVIVSGGMYITDDVRELPDSDREILEAQDIKSLAIFPLFYMNKAIGYIGFDDCARYRKWNSNEIHLLKSISNLVVTLIARRNAEQQALRSLEIMQTISDNMDNIIYVNDISTYEVIFINKTLADSINKNPNELIGKPCWKVLQKDRTGPCDFCPMPRMLGDDGTPVMENYIWEFQNTLNNKWYMVRDSIIKWIDGEYVHIETATEITHRKEYEEQLKYYASTDTMTNTYNREWGYKIMREMILSPYFHSKQVTLCFIDLDGLKTVNDTYGHDAGDDMIIQTVEAIRGNIRNSDILCRWGGDEFVLLLLCDTTIAERILQTIQKKLGEINASKRNIFNLSFSYGLTALGSGTDVSVDALIQQADQLMYKNKLAKRSI